MRKRFKAVVHLNQFRKEEEDGILENYTWDKPETRKEGKRKLLEQWDRYALARDSKWGWGPVQ